MSDELEILVNPGKVTQVIAKAFAESEFKNTGLCRIGCLNRTLINSSSDFWKGIERKRYDDQFWSLSP